MDKKNKNLAINGGKPVTREFILIHKPSLEEDDFEAVNEAMRSTFLSGDGPKCREFEKCWLIISGQNMSFLLFMYRCP